MTASNAESASAPPLDLPGTNRWYLSAAPIIRALVHLCVPMAAAMIVGAVYNVINAGFIGSLHDTVLLAAVTFGSPLLGLVMAIGGVFGVGGGALISRLLGASEHDPAKAGEIKHVSSFAVWGSVIVGAVLGGAGLLLLHPLVTAARRRCRRRSPRRAPSSRVMLAFVPVLAAAFCLEQLVRAEGAVASGDDRAHRLDDREPRLRRPVHPGAALGSRRRRAVDRSREPASPSPTSSSGCSGTASTSASRRAGSPSRPR